MLSQIEITVIAIIMSFFGGVIFGETQTTRPTSTANIAVTEAKGQCECGKTVDYTAISEVMKYKY